MQEVEGLGPVFIIRGKFCHACALCATFGTHFPQKASNQPLDSLVVQCCSPPSLLLRQHAKDNRICTCFTTF